MGPLGLLPSPPDWNGMGYSGSEERVKVYLQSPPPPLRVPFKLLSLAQLGSLFFACRHMKLKSFLYQAGHF